VLLGFAFIILKINRFLPRFILSPLEMLGNCSFPLAMIVVGASLAGLAAAPSLDRRVMLKLIFVKLVLLPSLGLLFISYFHLPYLMGLLIILELAVPSANSLAVISRQYAREEKIVSQGILYSHIACLVTLPVFLALYNLIVSRN
jgi:predicted permease